jgi:hypothetical protein
VKSHELALPRLDGPVPIKPMRTFVRSWARLDRVVRLVQTSVRPRPTDHNQARSLTGGSTRRAGNAGGQRRADETQADEAGGRKRASHSMAIIAAHDLSRNLDCRRGISAARPASCEQCSRRRLRRHAAK